MENSGFNYSITDVRTTQIGRFSIVQSLITKDGKEYPYSFLKESPCVCVFPIINEKVVLIRQYRYAISKWCLEIPCGRIEEGETPDMAAIRELREESGCVAQKMIYVGSSYARAGVSDCRVYFYLAECMEIKDQDLDPTEQIERFPVSIEKFEQMLQCGEFSQLMGIACWVRAKGKVCVLTRNDARGGADNVGGTI